MEARQRPQEAALKTKGAEREADPLGAILLPARDKAQHGNELNLS
jgi:hypothetical protein